MANRSAGHCADDMSDRLHDHLALGQHPGCVACAQLEADLTTCAASTALLQAVRAGS
jgi:hypothetical protein